MTENTDPYNLVNRRDMIKLGASATALGTTTTVSATTNNYGMDFDRVVNAVDDLGMDPNGNNPIDSELQKTMDDEDILVEFPPGEYLVEDTHSEGSLSNWGIRGLGDKPSDVRFVSNPGASKFLIKMGSGENVLIENLAIDYGFDKEGSLGLLLKANDNLRVQDVEFIGFNPTTGNGAVDNLSPQAIDKDGTVIVDGLKRVGPTDITSHGHLDGDSNDGCVWLGEKHVGTLIIRNSHIENTGTNAIYARRGTGDVKIEDSLFKNNNQTSLRIGGDGCYVKGCDFVVDTEDAHPDNGGEFINPHGVTWETGPRGDKGGYIEDCNFVYKNAPEKTAAAVWVDGSAGEMAILDSRFQLDADNVGAIRVDDPTDPRLGKTGAKPWGVTLDNVSITGDSDGDGAITIDNRDESVLANLCLHLTNRDGIEIKNSTGCTLSSSCLNVSGDATSFGSSHVSSSGITSEGTCPAPSLGNPTEDAEEDTEVAEPEPEEGGEEVEPVPGVEESAEPAESTLPNSLEIIPNGTKTNYRFEVTGALEDHPALGTPLTKYDDLGDGVLVGWATNDVDGVQFSGDVVDFEFIEGEATLYLNGREVSVEELVSGETEESEPEPEPKEVVVYGPDADRGRVDYRILYSGTADKADDSGDYLGDGVYEGSVWAGFTDSMQLRGEITAIEELTNDGRITVDGEEFTLPETTPEKRLVIEGTGPVVQFEFSVTGDLRNTGTLEDTDKVYENSVDGQVSTQDDRFAFTGELDSFVVTRGSPDDIRVTIDGEAITPSLSEDNRYPEYPNTITINGEDTAGVTGYEISVSGKLKRDTELSKGQDAGIDKLSDEIKDSSVIGVVDEGVDVYRFSGDIVTKDITGDAVVTFD